MTYHRTAGKNGSRNSPMERHPKPPNYNKDTAGGYSRPARKGKTVLNPGAGCAYKK